jgi:hypothetical protein
MATLNVNIRFRPLAHCNSEAKEIEVQRPKAVAERGDAQLAQILGG